MEEQDLEKIVEEKRRAIGLTQTGPPKLFDVVQRVVLRLSEPGSKARDEEILAEERAAEERRGKVQRLQFQKVLWAARGNRYRSCSLDSFLIHHDSQVSVRAQMRIYEDDLSANILSGRNLVLIGPPGTGKDHLMASLFESAISLGHAIVWTSGVRLYTEFRTAIKEGKSEADLICRYTAPDVLALSDPMPVTGALTGYQQETLYQILDERYNHRRCVWVTINAPNREAADAALGAKLVDRLVDGALSLACNWPSYRKAQEQPTGRDRAAGEV